MRLSPFAGGDLVTDPASIQQNSPAAFGVGAPTIFISAGEESGDLHGAALARALRERYPAARLIGLGGARMRAQGVETLAGLDELAVMGFVEVIKHLPFFIQLRKRVFAALEAERVDLVIPIDYPGFNLRLARHAKASGIPVLYYIAPQVWAWHKSRVRDLGRDADEVAVVLPFEEDFLRRGGVNARFVGHPLLDRAEPELPRDAWARGQGLDPARPLLALFPGSRAQEVGRHLELFSAAADLVVRRRPDAQPVIGVPGGIDRGVYGAARWPLIESSGGLLAVRHGGAGQERHDDAGGRPGPDAARGRLPDERGELRARQAGGEGAAHRPGEPDRGGPRGAGVRAGRRHAGRPGGCGAAAAGRGFGGAEADDRRLLAGARAAGRARRLPPRGGAGGGAAGEGSMSANPGSRAAGLAERMNSPQRRHEVHLRGLGGPAVRGVTGGCASAAGAFDGSVRQP